ncbi:MAG: PQQ-dependent sugar dehydrogenase [Sphingobium sp.]
MTKCLTAALLSPILLIGCGGASSGAGGNSSMTESSAQTAPQDDEGKTSPSLTMPFTITEVAGFNKPWAMTFLPGTSYALVTEKPGKLILFDTQDSSKVEVSGVPTIDYGGQGGLGDIVIAPGMLDANGRHALYLSYVEPGSGGTRGAAVARAALEIDDTGNGSAKLLNLQVIWRQDPKVTGRGHFSHRIAVAPDGRHIFISSGDRQMGTPAQEMNVNLGKIIRLKPDGGIPADNPFASQGGVAAQIWSLGHRNMLGLAFDGDGQLWASEMGPMGGDEINLVQRGGNYGWPEVSNGSHYSGEPIPDHSTTNRFTPPQAWWNLSISPAGMAYYNAPLFPQWHNSLLAGALSGKALVRLRIEGSRLVKADHWPMKRIREVETGPDGAIWLLEDGNNAKLLKLTPRSES